MGAFDDFTPPQQGGAFSGFAPPGQGDPSDVAIWNKPANMSLGDYMLAHLSKPFQGADQAANDYTRVAANALTFNQADRLQSWLTGNDLATERANTAASRDRLGAMAPIAEGAMYAMGPGELNIAGRLGGKLGGMAAEGALSGGLYGAGSVNDLSQAPGAALLGAGGGALAGVGGRMATKMLNPIVGAAGNALGNAAGAFDKPADITSELEAAKETAYGNLKSATLDTGDTRQALQGIRNAITAIDPTGGLLKNAPRSAGILDNLQDHAATNNVITAHDLVSMGLDKLRNIADTPANGGENEIKPIIKTGVENFLNSGPAAGMVSDAKSAYQSYANAKALQQWQEGLKDFGSSPAGDAQSIAQRYYDRGSPQFDALKNIATAGGGGQSAWGLMHAVHEPIDLAAAAVGLGHLAGPVGTAMSYGAVKPALGAVLKKGQQAATQNAIAGAYPALTGRSVAYQPNLSPAVRALLFGGLGPSGF